MEEVEYWVLFYPKLTRKTGWCRWDLVGLEGPNFEKGNLLVRLDNSSELPYLFESPCSCSRTFIFPNERDPDDRVPIQLPNSLAEHILTLLTL